MTRGLGARLHGVNNVGIPIIRGVGPTLIPRPQRMYLRFGSPIDTTTPARANATEWEAAVKERTQTSLESILGQLQITRSTDPFRHLNPLAWARAARATR